MKEKNKNIIDINNYLTYLYIDDSDYMYFFYSPNWKEYYLLRLDKEWDADIRLDTYDFKNAIRYFLPDYFSISSLCNLIVSEEKAPVTFLGYIFDCDIFDASDVFSPISSLINAKIL